MSVNWFLLGVFILAVWLLRVQKRRPIFQYLFFCRVPITCALLMVGLPLIAVFLVPVMLGNLLVLEDVTGAFLVALVSVSTGYMIVQTTELILQQAPERMELPSLFNSAPPKNRGLHLGSRLNARLWSILLALPLAVWICWASWALLGLRGPLAMGGGVGLGLLLFWLIALIAPWCAATFFEPLLSAVLAKTSRPLKMGKSRVLKKAFLGYGPVLRGDGTARYGRSHLQLAVPGLILGALFVLGSFVWEPENVKVPALFFLIFMILMIGYLLSGLTFFLDRFRFPLLGFLFGFMVLSPEIDLSRHYYQLLPYDAQPGESAGEDSTQAMVAAVQERLENQPQGNRVLVAIAASGGGIQSAAWTAQVLTNLYLDPEFGPDFIQSTCLLSTVSGGSVGAMFFLDRLPQLQMGPADQQSQTAQQIMEGAWGNRLPAIALALAYQDSFRLFGINYLTDRMGGRGNSLEDDFAHDMVTRQATFRGEWRDLIQQGRLPIPIFNATVVESGDRLLISPFDHPQALRAASFVSTYPHHDISAVTAARLSATFPYVSPLAVPWGKQGEKSDKESILQPSTLIADGGYFDTYGIYTLIEWLDKVILPKKEVLGLSHVLVVQINAFPHQQVDGEDGDGPMSAWKAAVLGPALVAGKVRVSTQQARNTTELELLKSKWQEPGLKIQEFDIRYQTNTATGEHEDPPLSWKLSPEQKKHIREAWTQWMNSPQRTELRENWQLARN